MQTAEERSKAVAEQIKELPPLPMVVHKLLGVVGNDGSSARDVTQALSGDQALASKVLRLVNSSFYGLTGKVSTISRAVVILGNSAIRNLALGLAAAQTLKKLKGSVDWDGFWQHTLTAAVSAQAFAKRLNYPEPEEAFICGLLHDIGHLICYVAFPNVYPGLISHCRGDLIDGERRLLGVNHAEVGRNLLEHWQIPTKLCQPVRFHHDAKRADPDREKLLTLVILGDHLACAAGSGFVDRYNATDLRDLCGTCQIRLDECGKILEQIQEQVAMLRDFFETQDGSATKQGESGAPVLIIAADDEHRKWLESLIRHFGYTPLTAPSLSGYQPGIAELTIVDTKGLKTTIQRLLELSSNAQEPVALLCDEGRKLPPDLAEMTRLPFDLTAEHIRGVMA